MKIKWSVSLHAGRNSDGIPVGVLLSINLPQPLKYFKSTYVVSQRGFKLIDGFCAAEKHRWSQRDHMHCTAVKPVESSGTGAKMNWHSQASRASASSDFKRGCFVPFSITSSGHTGFLARLFHFSYQGSRDTKGRGEKKSVLKCFSFFPSFFILFKMPVDYIDILF